MTSEDKTGRPIRDSFAALSMQIWDSGLLGKIFAALHPVCWIGLYFEYQRMTASTELTEWEDAN